MKTNDEIEAAEDDVVEYTPITDELEVVEVPRKRRDWRAWNDRSVKLLLVVAIALAAFAAGRFTVHQGPKTLADAMTQFRAGTLPAGTSATGTGGGFGGGFGGGAPGGGGFGGGTPAGAASSGGRGSAAGSTSRSGG